MKKYGLTQAEVLDKVGANVGSIEAYLAKPIMGAYPKHVPKKVLVEGYYFEDSDDIIFASYNLFFDKVSMNKKVDFGMDIGQFYAQDPKTSRINGWRYGISLYYKQFIVRLGENNYGAFSEFVPSITYKNSYKRHHYKFEFIQQNALFYTNRASLVNEKIKTNHFEFSDYVGFEDKSSLWTSIAVNKYTNSDTEVTAQFDWRFYYDTVEDTKFSYDLALEGWYTSHSKQTKLYYSPYFVDSTLLRIDPVYIFSSHLGVKGILGMGYSFKDKTAPYKFGMKFFGNPNDSSLYELGCLYSNSVRTLSTGDYYYLECAFSLGYTW